MFLVYKSVTLRSLKIKWLEKIVWKTTISIFIEMKTFQEFLLPELIFLENLWRFRRTETISYPAIWKIDTHT